MRIVENDLSSHRCPHTGMGVLINTVYVLYWFLLSGQIVAGVNRLMEKNGMRAFTAHCVS